MRNHGIHFPVPFSRSLGPPPESPPSSISLDTLDQEPRLSWLARPWLPRPASEFVRGSQYCRPSHCHALLSARRERRKSWGIWRKDAPLLTKGRRKTPTTRTRKEEQATDPSDRVFGGGFFFSRTRTRARSLSFVLTRPRPAS